MGTHSGLGHPYYRGDTRNGTEKFLSLRTARIVPSNRRLQFDGLPLFRSAIDYPTSRKASCMNERQRRDIPPNKERPRFGAANTSVLCVPKPGRTCVALPLLKCQNPFNDNSHTLWLIAAISHFRYDEVTQNLIRYLPDPSCETV